MSESTPSADISRSMNQLIAQLTNQVTKYTLVQYIRIHEYDTRGNAQEIEYCIISHPSVCTLAAKVLTSSEVLFKNE